jgi:hypothetical protein
MNDTQIEYLMDAYDLVGEPIPLDLAAKAMAAGFILEIEMTEDD